MRTLTMSRRLVPLALALALGLVLAGQGTSAAQSVTQGKTSFWDLLKLLESHAWKGTGPAEKHNMALFNWKHTGNGDNVHCDVCDRTEGGWSSHNPAQYHNAGCVFQNESYPKTIEYRKATFVKHGWTGKTGPAVMENMIEHGWLHTGNGDKVFCPWCQKIEGSWSAHDPVAYHNANCKCKTKGACNAGK
ncbi:MAG: hypothetical protein AMXMBFR64_13370 [Myxococcales bacterium]